MYPRESMGRCIGKSALWLAVYHVVQIIIMVCIIIFDAFAGKFDFFNETDDIETMANEFIEYINEFTLPLLIFSSIIIAVIFLIYKIKVNEGFDFTEIKFGKLSFMALIGLTFNGILSVFIAILQLILPDELFSSIGLLFNEIEYVDPIINAHPFVITLLGTGILVPVMEEIIFRFGICGSLNKNNRTAAIIISSVIFGLMHGNPFQTLYTCILGFAMAIAYVKFENIWYPIACHMAFNSLTVISQQFEYSGLISIVVGLLSGITILIMVLSSKEYKEFFKLEKLPEPVIKQIPTQYMYPQQQYYPQYVPNNQQPQYNTNLPPHIAQYSAYQQPVQYNPQYPQYNQQYTQYQSQYPQQQMPIQNPQNIQPNPYNNPQQFTQYPPQHFSQNPPKK